MSIVKPCLIKPEKPSWTSRHESNLNSDHAQAENYYVYYPVKKGFAEQR